MSAHVIVLPGGGYVQHAEHEAEPVAEWLGGLGLAASVFRYPLNARHPVPLDALRGEIARLRAEGADTIGLMGFSAGGHLAGLAALAPDRDERTSVQFAVLGYAITSMETETYRPSRLVLLGEDASPELRRATSLDALVTPSAPPFFLWHTAEDPYVLPDTPTAWPRPWPRTTCPTPRMSTRTARTAWASPGARARRRPGPAPRRTGSPNGPVPPDPGAALSPGRRWDLLRASTTPVIPTTPPGRC
ncbi:hypothetical protein [Streptomyces sp. NPDC091215]|uniref:alpha/beta hydrolase n=1 Tax=Streptomyces sp. NPDC091215 TaxID=3155192 RepID=UPI003417EEB2